MISNLKDLEKLVYICLCDEFRCWKIGKNMVHCTSCNAKYNVDISVVSPKRFNADKHKVHIIGEDKR